MTEYFIYDSEQSKWKSVTETVFNQFKGKKVKS